MLCTNSIVYLAQAAQPLGVSLNTFAGASTNMALRQIPNVAIALDLCSWAIKDPTHVFLALKTGDLYFMTMVWVEAKVRENRQASLPPPPLPLFPSPQTTDGRFVSDISFERLGTSVLPSCATVLGKNLLFLGSQLGYAATCSSVASCRPLAHSSSSPSSLPPTPHPTETQCC